MYGTTGETRRQVIWLVAEIFDGVERHAVTGLLASTFAGVLKLFEQSYAEANDKTKPAKSDTFGNETLALLSGLVVRLAKFGAIDTAVLDPWAGLGPVKSVVAFTAGGPEPAVVTLKTGQGGRKLAWCLLSGVPLMDGVTELTLEAVPTVPGGGGSQPTMQLVASAGTQMVNKPLQPPQPPQPGSTGVKVKLATNFADFGDAAGGCLALGDVGNVTEYGGQTSRRFRVKNSGGESWWYDRSALHLVQNVTRADEHRPPGPPQPLQHPQSGSIGAKVKLAPNFADFDDAAGGCLAPGDVGTVVRYDGSGKPFKVRNGRGSLHLIQNDTPVRIYVF